MPYMRAAALVAALVATLGDAAAKSSYCLTADPPPTYFTAGYQGDMGYRLHQAGDQRILIAEGGIRAGESGRLASAIAAYAPVSEIWFNSPGGDANEGPLMGRVVRKQNLAVRIPNNFSCASACTYAFLGGVVRSIDPGGSYGIHMFTGYGNNPQQYVSLMTAFVGVAAKRQELLKAGNKLGSVDNWTMGQIKGFLRDIEQRSAVRASAQAKFLVEMSASLEFMTDVFGTEADGMCFLNAAGLRRYNVTNVM